MNIFKRAAVAARFLAFGGRRSSGGAENPANDLYGDHWSDVFREDVSDTGIRVTKKKALGHSPIWRGVNLISSTVAKLPLYVYRNGTDGERKRAVDHPAYQLLRWKANDEMSAFTVKELLQFRALLGGGNGYAYIYRDTLDGSPLQLIPLATDKTYPIRVGGVLYYMTEVRGELRRLDRSEVLHIKGLSPDGLVGYDVVQVVKNSIGGGLAAEKFGSAFLKNSANPSIVIEHPKTLSKEGIEKLRTSFPRAQAGLDNTGRVAVLEEGAKVNPYSFNAQQAQLLELREHEVRMAANVLGLPPHKIGDTSRTAYASLEQENQSFLDDCLDPWLVRWEYECRDKLCTEEEKTTESAFVEFQRSALVRANMQDRYAAYSVALGGVPFQTRNEVRRLENLPPLPGGDEFLEPLNMAKSGGVAKSSGEKKARRDERRAREGREAALPAGLVRKLLVDGVGRMVRRIATQARRAAANPRKFDEWLDGVDAGNRSTISEALDGALEAAAAIQGRKIEGATAADRAKPVVDRLFALFRAELEGVMQSANIPEFSGAVERSMAAAENQWPELVADQVLTGEV